MTSSIETVSSEDRKTYRTKKCFIGYAFSMLALVGPAAGTACSQALAGYIPIFQVNTFRFLTQVIIVFLILLGMRQKPTISKEHILWLIGSAATRWLANVAIYESAIYLPAGTLHGVDNSMGAFVGMVSSIVATRSCRASIYIPFLFCLLGLVLVSQPTLLGFSPEPQTDKVFVPPCFRSTNSSLRQIDVVSGSWASRLGLPPTALGYGLAIGAGTLRGLGYIIIHYHLKDLRSISVSFWMGIFGLIASSCLMGISEIPRLPRNDICWGLFLGQVIPTGAGSLFVNVAAQLIPPAPLTILLTGEIIVTAILQYTVLKVINPGHQNWEEIAGIILLTIGNALVAAIRIWEARNDEGNEQEEEQQTENDDIPTITHI